MSKFFLLIVIVTVTASWLIISTPLQAGWLSYLFTGREVVDASDHPYSQAVIGKELRLLTTSFVVQFSDSDDHYSLNPPTQGAGFQPKSIEEYHQQVAQGTLNPQVIGLVEKGTRLKITRVTLSRSRRLGYELLSPYAIIQSGKFKGFEVEVSMLLRASLEHNDHMRLIERFAEFVDEETPVEKESHD